MDDEAAYFKKLAETQGIAIITAGDGSKVILASKEKLLELAKTAEKSGYVLILLQSDNAPGRTLN
jgi:hypothetical protein